MKLGHVFLSDVFRVWQLSDTDMHTTLVWHTFTYPYLCQYPCVSCLTLIRHWYAYNTCMTHTFIYLYLCQYPCVSCLILIRHWYAYNTCMTHVYVSVSLSVLHICYIVMHWFYELKHNVGFLQEWLAWTWVWSSDTWWQKIDWKIRDHTHVRHWVEPFKVVGLGSSICDSDSLQTSVLHCSEV